MLCDVCQLVFQGRAERTYSTSPFAYNHHRTALDVRAAANQGCHFCTLILSLLSGDEIARVLNHIPDLKDNLEHEVGPVQITSTSPDGSLRVAFPLSLQSRTYESEEFCVKFVKTIPAYGTLESAQGSGFSEAKSPIQL